MRINLLPALFVILAFIGIAATFNTCTDESTRSAPWKLRG